MKIKTAIGYLDVDDERFFSWLMGPMLLFVDFCRSNANITVEARRVGLVSPARVKVTVNSPADLLSIGRILKLEPLTHVTVVFPKLKAEATLNLMIYSSSIDIHVHGKGTQLSKSGTYESIVEDVMTIYKKCWDGADIPVLYGRTCADLTRMLKGKEGFNFIKTADYNWPLFCTTIAKLLTCIVAAEPFRCLLMHPVSMMELMLGKHGKRPLNPITNFSGSASALVNIQTHFEADRRDEELVPSLSPEGKAMLLQMSEVVAAWAELVLEKSKKRDTYLTLLTAVEAKKLGPIALLQAMVEQKILNHLDTSLKVKPFSLNEMVHDVSNID